MNTEVHPIPIGYLARRTHRKPPFLQSASVEEICSVVDHMIHVIGLPKPGHWYHQNRHNALRHFDSEEIAWTALRDEIHIQLDRDDALDPPWRVEIVRLPLSEFDLYAFKMLPVRFLDGKREDFTPPGLRVAPIPADYKRLGYDVVGWNQWAPFECSPLLCNLEAAQSEVNHRCLFDETGPAMELARRYSGKDWQPIWPNSGHCTVSAYCVVEVWRKAKPFPEPARCGAVFEWPPDLLQRLVQHTIAHGNVFDR